MPKSRHRKNQKKKSKARTEKIKAQQQAMRKDMEKRFAAYMEEMKNRSMNIEEVDLSLIHI